MQWAREGMPSVEIVTERAAQRAVDFEEKAQFDFAAFEKGTGQFVGMFSLFDLEWSVPRAETGFWLSTPMTGRGLAAEALTSITACAFALGMVRIELRTDAGNAKSHSLAVRCGYQLEGVLRQQRRCPRGMLADTCVYARLFTRSDTAS